MVSSTASACYQSTQNPDTETLGGGFDDGLGAIYVAIGDLQQEGVCSGNALVRQTETETAEQQAAQQAAEQRAQADTSSSGGGFFGHIFKACGDFVDDCVHGHFGQAFGDAGNDLARAWNTPHFWADMSKVMNDLGAASNVLASVAPLLGPLAAPVEVVAGTGEAVGEGGKALATLRTSQYQVDADDANDDAQQAQNTIQLLSTREQQSLSELQGDSQCQQGSLSAVVQAIQTNDGTCLGAAHFRIRG
jgi:hypothetical protein